MPLLPLDFYFRDRLYGFTAKGIRRPMFVKHEDSLGFISLRPLWLALIHLHAERVYVVEEKDQRKNFTFRFDLPIPDLPLELHPRNSMRG